MNVQQVVKILARYQWAWKSLPDALRECLACEKCRGDSRRLGFCEERLCENYWPARSVRMWRESKELQQENEDVYRGQL